MSSQPLVEFLHTAENITILSLFAFKNITFKAEPKEQFYCWLIDLPIVKKASVAKIGMKDSSETVIAPAT